MDKECVCKGMGEDCGCDHMGPDKKKKRLAVIVEKNAGAGPISVANMTDQLGPVSSHVMLTQTNIPAGNKKTKKKLFPDVIVKSANIALDEAIEKLSKNCDNR